MSDAIQSRFQVTAEDLRRYDWQARLASHTTKECYDYCKLFVSCVKECEATNDDLGKRVYSLLNVVTSFMPNYDKRGNPYGSMWSGIDGKRSLNAEDLTDKDIDALRGIMEDVEDPECRARIADVVWVCKKDFQAAQIAIRAFLESARHFKAKDMGDPISRHHYVERLERAAQISAKRGFEALNEEVLVEVESAISEYKHDIKLKLFCFHLMSILLAQRKGDASHYGPLAEELAHKFASLNDWLCSKDYWNIAIQWHQLRKNAIDMQRCKIEAAECNISRAEAGLNGKTEYGYSAHWMGRGLEALRQAKADSKRIEEVHLKLLNLQERSLSEMKPISIDEEDIPGLKENKEKIQEASVAYVRGHSFEKALIRFANIDRPTDVIDLRRRFEEQSETVVWDKIMPMSVLDRSGKTTGTTPPVSLDSSETDEDAIRKRMLVQAKGIDWKMKVGWTIEPARMALLEEHSIRLQNLAFLVTNNPFIPPGHEGIYLHGIQNGFFGDWLTSMNLLIPQIEASIRHVLQQHGAITSTLSSDFIQKELNINKLLWRQDVKEIFGENILFDLRGCLIEPFGCNMRGESAHGLMPEAAFYQEASVYFWWLVIHLCWWGFVGAQSQS